MDRYPAPVGFHRSECDVKRSRFITSIDHVNNKAQAKAFIAKVRQQYPDANHHCWAMIAGAPDDLYQQDQSDDGEPKGTAGKPMLNVLQHSELGNIVVVVTRYFGGIKLGAGGLVRAYTRAVSEPLKTLDTQMVVLKTPVNIKVPYAELALFEHWLQSTDIDVSEKSFTDSVALTLQVPAEELTQLTDKLKALGGQLKSTD
jgi:uncharacterized YigZ family protein